MKANYGRSYEVPMCFFGLGNPTFMAHMKRARIHGLLGGTSLRHSIEGLRTRNYERAIHVIAA